MTRRLLIGILVVLVLVAGAVGVGAMAYRAGVVQGAIASGQLDVVPGDGRGPHMMYYNMPFGHGHMGWGWGGGFGFLRCLFPLFGLLLLLALFRLAFGHRRWGWGGGPGRWGGSGMGWGNEPHAVPPAFEEWHRRAHGETPPAPPAGPTPPQSGA